MFRMERLLQNATEPPTEAEKDDELDGSWTPIWVVIVLTLAQIVVWLSLFECNRRSKNMAIVFDRRRQTHPERTPPPLMRRRGLLNGWLGFEWWRLQLNQDYYRLSQQEYDKRLDEEDERDHGPKYDKQLLEAEKQCQKEAFQAVPEDYKIELFQKRESFDEAGLSSSMAAVGHAENGAGDEESVEIELPDAGLPSRPKGHVRRTSSGGSSSEWDARIVMGIGDFLANRVLKTAATDVDSSDDEEEHVRAHGVYSSATLSAQHNNDESIHSGIKGLRLGYIRKVNRRRLSKEQRELLRIVGLDAFMTLRFLRFGFDVTFWPLLLACAMLIPIYKTGAGGLTGWYSITVQNLREQSPRLWALCVFSFLQYGYVLRRIWIEWEMFLPLRYDFLERGDFHKEGYQEQYRNSCLVEYVPRSHKLNKDLYEFFDVLFPGQIRRAEVLINTESLRKLIKERNGHIVSYEDAYARKVHRRAEYLRDLETFREGDSIDRCCRGAIKEPQKPAEEDIIIIHKVHTRQGNFDPRMNLVKDPRTYPALEYYLSRIDVCNGLVDEEFVRLALEKRKPKQEKRSEFWIEKAVGLRYITGSDTGRLHSSTAFVEFCCLTAKQQAIQCNITGTNKFMEVRPAPGLNEIIWGNAHVSRSLINTRRGWANVYLTINLIFWSMFVTFIRSRGNLSKLIPGVGANSSLAVILDAYVPVLILEGLVRIAPFYIAFICQWIRYKQSSEIDIYVLQWYFGFRLVSFLFIIIGGSLVDTASSLVDNPGDFLEEVSYNAARQSLYFTTYITMTTGFSCFFFMSQTHNVLLHWVGLKVFTEEATSARRLEHFQKYIKKFGSRELVPLFIFAMMISLLYGGLAPLTNLFVVIFFKLAYKVYKFMFVYVYGNEYEGGGVLFYTLNIIFFVTLYIMIVVLTGYFAINGSIAMASVFILMLAATIMVHKAIQGTFVQPSRTLALTKARVSDEGKERERACKPRSRSLSHLKSVKKSFRDGDTTTRFTSDASERKSLMDSADGLSDEEMDEETNEETKRRLAVEKIEKRYERPSSSLSHAEQGKRSSSSGDYFIYRQPSMNRATWEVSPRPYRDDIPILSIEEIGAEDEQSYEKTSSTNRRKRKPPKRTTWGKLVSEDYAT